MRPWLLRLHRWTTLVFALPLAVVILTGLVLSFEPVAQTSAIRPGGLTAARIIDLLRQHDPQGKATAISHRGYEATLTLQGVEEDGLVINTRTGQKIDDDDESWSLSEIFSFSRGLHERLIFDSGLAVAVSTYAMLALMALGIFMGWPSFRNTVAGWHKGTAWALLPLLILSPLTGLAIFHGVTFASPPQGPRGEAARVPIAEAVRMAGEKHDLSGLVWIRTRGGRLLARVYDGNEARVFQVTKDGLTAAPRNWPRAIHEGNWAGALSGWINVLISVALTGLMITGLWVWARRHVRRLRNRAARGGSMAPQPAE